VRQFDSDWQTQPNPFRLDRRILYKVVVARALLYYALEGATMNVNAFEAIVYLLIMVGGSGLLVIIMAKVNRHRRNRRIERGVANYLRQMRR
jgi:hypothetical protein